MKEHRNTTCDPCEQDFKRKVDELVREGKAPSHMDRSKREHEVKSAFADEHHGTMHGMGHKASETGMKKEPAHAAPGKPAAKPHAMAGVSKMKK